MATTSDHQAIPIPSLSPFAGKGRVVVACVLVFLVVIWGGIENHIATVRRQALEQAQSTMGNLSRAFELHVTHVVEEVDNVLRALRWQLINQTEDEFNLSVLGREPGYASQFVSQFGLIDADGLLRDAMTGKKTGIDLSDRPHFRAHSTSFEDELYVGPPAIARTTNAWSIFLSRRVIDKEGQFRGVLVAAIDPFALSSVYASFNIGRTSIISLIGNDMIIRARAPQAGDSLGKVLDLPGLQEKLISTPVGFFENTDASEAARLTAYRAVAGLPLAIIVSEDKREIFAAANLEAIRSRTAGVLVTAAVLILFGRAAWYRAHLLKKRYRLLMTLQHLNEGVMIVEKDGKVSHINQKAIDLLDLPQAYLTDPPSYRDLFTFQLDRGEFGPNSELADKSLLEGVWTGELSAPKRRSERKRPNGTVIGIETVRLPHGGFLRTFNDITQQHRDAEAVQVAVNELEHLSSSVSPEFKNSLEQIIAHAKASHAA